MTGLILCNPRPLTNLGRASNAYGAATELPPAIDHSRWFVCPTLTPLYYTSAYRDLSELQQRRYNQLTAMCFSELIALFEQMFAHTLHAAVKELRGQDDSTVTCLEQFVEDEREHVQQWQRLNQMTEPGWYAHRERVITHIPAMFRAMVKSVAQFPQLLPANLWLMLALEEHSLEISRRCLRMDANRAEPAYRAAYRHHATDEVRHVQLDWHLIERFQGRQSRLWQRANATYVAQLISRVFLPPRRSAMRVVDLLVREDQTLKPLRSLMRKQLCAVAHHPMYRTMMYSPQASPILFALLEAYPEMRPLRRILETDCTPRELNDQ